METIHSVAGDPFLHFHVLASLGFSHIVLILQLTQTIAQVFPTWLHSSAAL